MSFGLTTILGLAAIEFVVEVGLIGLGFKFELDAVEQLTDVNVTIAANTAMPIRVNKSWLIEVFLIAKGRLYSLR